MEPIISSWYFYLIGVSDNLKTGCGVLIWIFLVIALASGWTYFSGIRESLTCTWFKEDDKRTLKNCQRIFIISIIIGLLCFLICLLLPNASTSYQMLAASLITPDNLSAVGGSIESIIDYIIEISQQLAP